MFAKKLLAISGTLSCALTVSAANAQTQVAFIGGTTMCHLMVGGADAVTDDAHPVAEQLQSFETCFANVVTTINEWVMNVDAVPIP
jgi:hypothetical protein